MTPHALIAPARLAGIPLLRTQTDERLVDLVRAGNDAAFEAIVARYRRPLLRYCSRLLSEERAEDAVQQAFLSAYDSLRSSRREMHLRPWLYRIAHNSALNALRDRGIGHEELSEQLDGLERPDQAYEKSQRLRDVVAAVELLPERQRDAIVLRELEGRSYEEIAASLGVSDGAVRQLLNRARTTLRAGATALTPAGLLGRVPWLAESSDGMATRVAELCVAGTGGAVVTKVCATALVTGAVFGGVATAPEDGDESSARPPSDRGSAIATGPLKGGHFVAAAAAASERHAVRAAREDTGLRDNARRRRDADDGSERSGRRGGDDERSSSGPGSGEPDDLGSDSGPGANSGSGSDSSGPGSGGSGSGSSGSGSSGSGSGGSGSGSSGSGSSGSGSSDLDGSGSGSSGSGSGSGSSGSGSGDEAADPDGD